MDERIMVMRLKLEARPQPSQAWSYGSPLLALLCTVVIGVILFALLGKDPVRGLQVFFWDPIKTGYALGELLVKATPLLLIALGLAVCFRSNVWNIGAEGQYIMGAIAASGVALMADKATGGWMVVPVVIAGVLGGMAWAGITALLRDRFNANEILVSLMLVYVAVQLLGYLVFGPWKDPNGYNFPQTQTFEAVTRIPRLFDGSRGQYRLGVCIAGGSGHLGVFVSHPCRLCAAGGGAGSGGSPLCRVFIARRFVDGAVDLGRYGGPGGRAGGGGPHRPAHTVCARRLWVCSHHRSFCRSLASRGHGVLCFVDEHVLHRR